MSVANPQSAIRNSQSLPPDDDAAWAALKSCWSLRPGVTYLNHGSFGPSPDVVRAARRHWQERVETEPMDFFVRELEPSWLAARDRLARFVGTASENLIFVENATSGMNIVADSFPLAPGDEVLLNDHEYGAVLRIWQRACQKAGAVARIVELPIPFRSVEETVGAIFSEATGRTRLVVTSHITSPTAVTLPVKQICEEASRRGIAVCLDGPHAIAQLPLAIDALGCDYYAASCHKWLSAPFGSGFLYVSPLNQSLVRPPVLSWGRIPPTRVATWADEFIWAGTRDPSAYFAIPAAIDFLEEVGLDAFRPRTHWLARYARRKLVEQFQTEPILPDDPAWYGSMAHVPLPPPVGRNSFRPASPADSETSCAIGNPLPNVIFRELGIEVPIVEFRGRRYIRVSCHLYNDTEQIDRLVSGLAGLLEMGR